MQKINLPGKKAPVIKRENYNNVPEKSTDSTIYAGNQANDLKPG